MTSWASDVVVVVGGGWGCRGTSAHLTRICAGARTDTILKSVHTQQLPVRLTTRVRPQCVVYIGVAWSTACSLR
jgi:hypothetical protein